MGHFFLGYSLNWRHLTAAAQRTWLCLALWADSQPRPSLLAPQSCTLGKECHGANIFRICRKIGSRCGGGGGEVRDLQSHFHTSIFQGSHRLTRSSALIPDRSLMNVPCSWWQGPLMSSNFLCSFPALLEGLGIILLLLCSARARES